jgi:ATP-dependent exoDNAse (exonuclease V) beta subunit
VEAPTSPLGVVAASSASRCAEAVAAEIRRLLDVQEAVRDPTTRELRPMSARDVGILFRTKDSHRDFEKALAAVGVPSYVYKGLGFFEADEIKDVLALLRYLASPDSDLRAAAFLRSRFVRISDKALQSLAPRLARALTTAGAAGLESLGPEDRLVLAHTRSALERWLSLADRVPPADLLEMILDETAYAFETRGVRVRQARENLKKMRGMIRRLQNRGYATLSRVADHLDRLTAGDESNAVIDAGDSVSLMTIHAAKGLEFPIVFVVNLSRGTGGRRPALRVVSAGDEGEAWLSVGDFQSEADADAKAKEREETKRLLYVALTRARDRLYLASDVKDGKWRAFGGSLGDVLPTALKGAFEAAAIAAESGNVEWVAASGNTHAFRICPVPVAVPDQSADRQMIRREGAEGAGDRLEPLIDTGAVPRLAITAQLEPIARVPARSAEAAGSERSLVGTLVHRLFERAGRRLAESPDRATLESALGRLLTSDERVEAGDLPGVLSNAADAYLALAAQPDLCSELEAGDALFEVPFSVRPTASQPILRGTFDCVVRRRDGGVMVLELKTGRPVPQHAQQLSMYLTAARALFPEARVDGKLVYAHLDRRPLDSER